MKMLYSIGTTFAGGGIGNIAAHAVRGLYRQGMLQRLLCGAYVPSDIPATLIKAMGWPDRVLRKLATYDQRRWLWHVQSVLFDQWAARHQTSADLFHVWGGYGLTSLKQARRRGMLTVVERASTHPRYQARVLAAEYARRGIPYSSPNFVVQRAIAEVALADYILVPSEFVRQTFLVEGVPAERLLLLPFGVDLTRFTGTVERQTNQPFRVLFVGQIGVRKGVLYLLEAWQHLGWRDAELGLVGRVEPGFQPLLRRYAHLPGVRWADHMPDPVASYQSADLFAFPSLEEGSALVTYEAMAAGLPVITTANAGSVVRDGQDGLLVPIQDSLALATALEQLRADPARRRTMGHSARQRVAGFSWTAYGDAVAEVFRQLILSKNT